MNITDRPTSVREIVAASCLISLINGLVFYRTLVFGIFAGVPIYFAIEVSCGLIVGTFIDSGRRIARLCVLPAVCAPVSYAAVTFARWIIRITKDPSAFRIPAATGGDYGTASLETTIFEILGILVFGMLGTYVILVTSAFSTGLIKKFTVRVFAFGPEGIKRIEQILLAMCAVVSAVCVLWGSLAQKGTE